MLGIPGKIRKKTDQLRLRLNRYQPIGAALVSISCPWSAAVSNTKALVSDFYMASNLESIDGLLH